MDQESNKINFMYKTIFLGEIDQKVIVPLETMYSETYEKLNMCEEKLL